MIDYLRSPPGRDMFYVHQAQEALKRKKDFVTWLKQREPDTDNMVLPSPTHSTLSLGESEERSASPTRSSSTGSGVRSSNRRRRASRCRRTLRGGGPREAPAHLGRIGHGATAARRPALGFCIPTSKSCERCSGGQGTAVRCRKGRCRPAGREHRQRGDDCKEFEAAVCKWKELRHLEPAELKKALEASKTSSGRSFLDVLGKVATTTNS